MYCTKYFLVVPLKIYRPHAHICQRNDRRKLAPLCRNFFFFLLGAGHAVVAGQVEIMKIRKIDRLSTPLKNMFKMYGACDLATVSSETP